MDALGGGLVEDAGEDFPGKRTEDNHAKGDKKRRGAF